MSENGSRPTNVRSTSKSGVKADILEPPLSANIIGAGLLDRLVGAAECPRFRGTDDMEDPGRLTAV
jgi:hypothetical protein